MMWGNQMWGSHWMFGGYMWIVWLAVLVGLVLVLKVILTPTNKPSDNRPDSSMEILKKGYAKGDISKDEFEERKKVLSS